MTEKVTADDIRAAKAAYMRGWRSRNKDRVREINQRYWARYAAKRKEAEHEQKADTE